MRCKLRIRLRRAPDPLAYGRRNLFVCVGKAMRGPDLVAGSITYNLRFNFTQTKLFYTRNVVLRKILALPPKMATRKVLQ